MALPSRTQADVLVLQLPSPPGRDVLRDYAGGFGVSLPSVRSLHGHGPFTMPSLSLVYAASALKQAGHAVRYLDAQAERLSGEQLRLEIAAVRPKAVLAIVSLPSFYSDLHLLTQLKGASDARVIVLGTVCKAAELRDELLAHPSVDAVVTGDIEVVAVDLVERALSGEDLAGEGVAVPGESAGDQGGGLLGELDDLPLPAFDLLPMDRYSSWEFGRTRRFAGREFGPYARVFPLYLSRGCPYACAYCPYPLGMGNRWRHKSVARVVEEFGMVAETGTRNILLRDQTVAEDLDFLEGVCDALIEAQLGVQWLCETRPGSLPPDLMRLMHSAGCVRIHYGVETGDEDVFAEQAKRGIDPHIVDRCLRDTELAGITPSLHFLVGFPEDSWRSVASTLELIARCRVSNGDCSLMTPYPGTRHYKRMREEGRILASSWEDFTGTEPIVRVDGLSPVELVTARWRILAAIDANGRRRGVRRRTKEAALAFRGGMSAVQGGPPIDVAISRAGRGTVEPAARSANTRGIA